MSVRSSELPVYVYPVHVLNASMCVSVYKMLLAERASQWS